MSETDPVSVAIRQIRQVEPEHTHEYIDGQLSDQQHTVLRYLREKSTLTAAAEAAGVPRCKVYRWTQSDPFFIAAYNEWKAEVAMSADTRLAHAVQPAVENLEKAIAAGDAKLSYQFLKDRGCLARQEPGMTDPGLIRQRLALDIQRDNPIAGPKSLTELLYQVGLSRAQQRELLLQTLKFHHPNLPRAIGSNVDEARPT